MYASPTALNAEGPARVRQLLEAIRRAKPCIYRARIKMRALFQSCCRPRNLAKRRGSDSYSLYTVTSEHSYKSYKLEATREVQRRPS
jgi:hypothetical protein